MVGKGGRPLSPGDYIRGACELHLQAKISDTESLASIDRFLSAGQTSPNTSSTSSTSTTLTTSTDGIEPSSSSTNQPTPRLFVWIPRRRPNTNDEDKHNEDGDEEGSLDQDDEFTSAVASTDLFDGNNLGALAFVNTSVALTGGGGGGGGGGTNTLAPVRSIAQLQCMTLAPRIYPETIVDSGVDGGEGNDRPDTATEEKQGDVSSDPAASTSNPGSSTFLSLQLYARHCFVPAVEAIEALSTQTDPVSPSSSASTTGLVAATPPTTTTDTSKKSRALESLEDKLRELDVALSQCRRSALGRIPHITLRAHPLLMAKARDIPSSGKLDLDELGLADKLRDDSFLNEVQTSVTTWINQIRSVTVLPSTTTFPTIDDSTTDDPDDHNTTYPDLEETAFWSSLEQSLQHVRSELSQPPILLSLHLLKQAKRFVATIALENNTGLDSAETHVGDVTNFLRRCPVDGLVAAGDWGKIGSVVEEVFTCLPRVRQSRYYGLGRCVKLLEAMTLTLRRRMLGVLRELGMGRKGKGVVVAENGGKGNGILLRLTYPEYESGVYNPTQDIFVAFDAAFEDFVEFLVDQNRRRRGAGGGGGDLGGTTKAQIAKGIVLYHNSLRERLDAVHVFRTQHEKLRLVVTEVLSGERVMSAKKKAKKKTKPSTDDEGTEESKTPSDDNDEYEEEEFDSTGAIREVEDAPLAIFATVDVLDLSPRGKLTFANALEAYDRKIDTIEERLATLLRDKLTACRDAEDMFAVFARFNPLLTRTRVRTAVKEFQMRLISTVAAAIRSLQSKFTLKYEASPASRLSVVRGIPPVSGKIMWARQIDRQVRALMRRMNDVLGPNWGQHLEGRQLKRSGDELLGKLDAKAFFRAWVTEWERELSAQATAMSARLNSYPIVVSREIQRGGRKETLVAKVNFDEKYELLFREIRHLKWLGFERDIPKTLILTADENLARYPHAMALKAALRSYAVARELITADLAPLLRPQLNSIRDSIAEAFGVSTGDSSTASSGRRVRWDVKEMSEWVAGLTELVSRFEERVETLLTACDSIDELISELGSVAYDSEAFRNVLGKIQKIVDDLSLAGYTDLKSWVVVLDDKLGVALKGRLEQSLLAWCRTFQVEDEDELDENDAETSRDKDNSKGDGMIVKIPKIGLEILLRNQEISSSPPIPSVRTLFLKELHRFIGIICSLPRPTSGRFEIFELDTSTSGNPNSTAEASTFSRLIQEVSPQALAKAYSTIESHMQNISSFCDKWFAYQTLWDTQVADVSAAIGQDMTLWNSLLLEAAAARNTLDSTATIATFGPMIVKYDKVQSQINLKYDSWQRELQSCYASVVGVKISTLHEKVCTAKSKLEGVTLQGTTPTQEVVLGLTYTQEMKHTLSPWGQEVDALQDAERLLRRQRHAFRADWIEASRLRGQYQNLEQILSKRSASIQDQMPVLQSRITSEDAAAQERTTALLHTWEDEKPLRGNMTPAEAQAIFVKFEISIQKAMQDNENLIKAKDVLGLEATTSNQAVTDCWEEMKELKEVWQAVAGPWESLEEIKAVGWNGASTRKIRKQLEDITAVLRALPNKVRQFDPYIHFNDTIKGYLSGHSVLADLKTEALKPRHWKTIFERLGIKTVTTTADLTIGILWESGVLTRKKEIGEILTVAQGEMALEVFLAQVRDKWMKQELELVLYQNRVRLIKGWDNLFTALDDHLNGLVLMKSSPYFRAVREFQEEGKLWEERLTKLRSAFDSWVDVQRRWVYLEGIFFGSSDIKAQLPAEWSRFKNVDSEFVTLMRRVSSRPYAMEALNIENLQRALERLESLMVVIQRALGDYLAKQRIDFSRFYFLGDDDLLEIIGNSGEPGKVLAHLGKMFAAVSSVQLGAPSTETVEGVIAVFDAMVSKDGEVVPLMEAIAVKKKMAVKDWLRLLEDGMHTTLAKLLFNAVQEDSSSSLSASNDSAKKRFVEWAEKFPAQVMILASLINWSMGVDAALSDGEKCKLSLEKVLAGTEEKLEIMAQTVLLELPTEARKKFEQLITELVHQRDVTSSMLKDGVSDPNDFRWLYHLRFKYNPLAEKLMEKLRISLSNAHFFYGFEYLGIGERLVQTPLTDRCYLTLTQALHFRMGGNPFGPAGTGKTESVKALGGQLGRFVVVMNCDETFDFGAMGRIFKGLCQVGAWGCFDEFNRLEERILSAVSQQVLTIQRGLIERQQNIELLGQTIKLHENVGIFVTMNPGYKGRSNLPDNLKNLFRSVAMVVPDRKLIAQVMLYSQGIVSANHLSGKLVDLFQLCESRMSEQSHYDFGLRALKTLLCTAGALKRKAVEEQGSLSADEIASTEKDVIVVGAFNNVVPKLVEADLEIFATIMKEVFPGSSVHKMDDQKLREELDGICESLNYIPSDNWVQKIFQLKEVITMRHGVMLVGPSGVGKSSALHTLQKGLEKIDGIKGEMYIIDPKAMNKDNLYGVLDGTTMEWTDGIFTSLLRKIIANQKGEADRRHWIVFDGDVDPVWAENMNSVLDDNKLLTLPSGERLSIPSNVRIILEVDNLAHATPATVSRCGMVWFSRGIVSSEMCLENLYLSLKNRDFTGNGSVSNGPPSAQIAFLEAIKSYIVSSDTRSTSLVLDALEFSLAQEHIMTPTRERLIESLKALLIKGIEQAIDYDENHPDFPMSGDHIQNYSKRWLLHSLLWSFAGSAPWTARQKFGEMVLRSSGTILPSGSSLTDYQVRVDDGEYDLWTNSVPRMEIESHKVMATDVVITTTDTVRHSDVISAWLSSRMPLILCGPPGSGKTMTLVNVLQNFQGIFMANLNFSSRTTPEIILKTFSQYCTYVRRGKDTVLEPSENLGAHTWLVVFCDEINLPENDSYGTQRVIMFMRQLVEQKGFWRSDNVWIKVNRIQFVGACNPPTDAGRVVMSSRFLRHAPLLLVDFPERDSLVQIYRTFNGGMLKLFPNLKGETAAITEGMVELYSKAQKKFTTEIQPQYFYSPRELSRWVRGIYEAIVHMDSLTRDELVQIWVHEAQRLFCDRLVEKEESKWCNEAINEVARTSFAGIDHNEVFGQPLYYSTWLSKDTRRVSKDEIREFLSARLRVFYEEELDVPLVIFDEVLDHILRIDRVLRQPMGHCLLVGDSGAGKTVLSKFVSWMNGLSIFQIKAHSKYSLEDFNEDLRTVMRRVGIEEEKVCFIFDESNALGSGFLEAMNALLASGEVPGLFENDDYTSLMSAMRDSSARSGVIADSEEELWKRFTSVVQKNLHVVFTMNPSGGEWKTRSTTSPALFNRCVVDWFGSWSPKAMGEVGKEFTMKLDMGDAEGVGGSWGIGDGEHLMDQVSAAFDGKNTGGFRQAVVAALVSVHDITKGMANECALSSSGECRTYLSPRDYLALIHNFVSNLNNLREKIEDEQLHVNAGLSKLRQTQENVAEMKKALSLKKSELRNKENLANQKLQQMVGDQNEAEKRKEEAEKMRIEVDKQSEKITVQKDQVQRDLDEAEPALLSAQSAVKGIRKRELDEVRNLLRPPNNVRLTLECVAIMLGEKNLDWGNVRKIISKPNFIPSILGFAVDNLTSRQVKIIQDKYLEGNEELSYESVTKSSKACGPLYKWAESQIKYSTVFNRVQPLRDEVEKLENEAEVARKQKNQLEDEVGALETSIAQYKADYASLIRDVEALKTEMEVVSTKVDRAESLIKSLHQESGRWSKSTEGFQLILRSLVGDALLMASFLTYCGFFDFKARLTLMKKWRNSLDMLGIEYRENLSMVEVLSKESDRLRWQQMGLPSDSLSLENGVILQDCARFPLIIDPSGHAIDFIMNKYKGSKIQKTSFLDNSFMKTLAGAIRFGTTLLIENVESIDPVLNPILNKEIQRTGGRALVQIGSEEVDYSPKFNIILTTKNPAAKLTPDICSRVTLVNFSITPASLQSQSMSLILKTDKPEVEEQRISIMKVQGEQLVKLRGLEEQMLSKISAVEGNILDDDRVVEGMELLMTEGAQVEEQISKSVDVMKQVERAMGIYEPLAETCKALYILLQSMREIHFLYEFSAKAFMKMLESALNTTRVDGSSDEQRISQVKEHLFREVAARVGRSLSIEDKMVFALLLMKLRNGEDQLVKGDFLLEDITAFIDSVFDSSFPWQGRGLNELVKVTQEELDSSVPLMLCSAPGYDVSGRVETMARSLKKDLSSIAMGSSEGFGAADRLVLSASKQGAWVMLKNCHLCIDWLQESLVKKLQTFGVGTHPDFRLFITCEKNQNLPTGLLRLSDIIVAEAPSGIKASLSRFFSSISSDHLKSPSRNRLYLILGWVHSVIHERLRYVPAGWSEAYEFTESDALHAVDVMDSLVEGATKRKDNFDPEKLPWDAIRTTLCKGIFGGRITKEHDQEVLDKLVSSVFIPESYDVNFKLVDTADSPCLPDGTSQDECLSWINSLPSYTHPTWIGLDGSAETIRSKTIAESVMSKFEMMTKIPDN